MVVPTLVAGDALADCLRSLESQTLDRFEVMVVDNSGIGLAKAGGSRVFSYQGLADEYLVDTDDVEVKVKRTDDESSLEWPDGAS